MAKKRKRRCAGKGSSYERDFCRQLTEWWRPGSDDVLFWRASQSGGRAKFRARKGKRAGFGHGDIVATTPAGEALIDLITFEVKRGYQNDHLAELFDRPSSSKQQAVEGWVQQAMESAKDAGSYAWMIVQRRNQRQAIVIMPQHLFEALTQVGCPIATSLPFATILHNFTFRQVHKVIKKKGRKQKVYRVWHQTHKLYVTTLAEWLECVTPAHIKKLSLIC